ncbi:putative lipase atg15 [Rhizophlyctis rosea]|nr:putative lipase atg15 [Rhizophlyctis rosea]
MRYLLPLSLLFASVASTSVVQSVTTEPSASGTSNLRLRHIFAAGNVPASAISDSKVDASRRGIFLKRYDVIEGDEFHSLELPGRIRWREQEMRQWSLLSQKRKKATQKEGLIVQHGARASLSRASQKNKQSPLKKQTRVPDSTDPETVLTMGRMTYNSYSEPEDKGWIDIPGWSWTDRFGWVGKGIRGYVFTDDETETMVIVLKGTTLATPVGGGPTAPEDKFNTIYLAVRDWFPKSMHIWMAGHSLGGALASLIALTNDLPAFAFEAPGDLQYAERIGLLPDLPPGNEPEGRPDWTDFLRTLPIYHFGNTLDPIYFGQCTGPSSSCYWFDYALETRCHLGYECIYDDADANKTTTSGAAISPPTPYLKPPSPDHAPSRVAPDAMSSVRYHTIDYVIKNFLEKWDHVPECKVVENCLANECSEWKWTA